MIYGIGTDIVEIARIKRMLDKYDNSFIERIFTAEEIVEAERRGSKELYYAGRWAAKESFAKALGSGIGEKCGWLDIAVTTVSSGAPRLKMSPKLMQRWGFDEEHYRVLLSLSHESKYACATVIIEKN